MILHCAFIGFGKSTTRYHLPYVLHRKDRWHVAHIYRRSARPEEQAPAATCISPESLLTTA